MTGDDPQRPEAFPTALLRAVLGGAVEGRDRLVDRLENYRLKLADPQASLKSIQPLLDDMAASSEKLAPKLEHLDEGDPLKDILNRSLVMVALEITRFNRGDYL